MCGICGSIGIDAGRGIVRTMTAALRHRGPDGVGFLERGPIQFGMRRLAIIDLNTGDQPIYNEDRSIAVINNGEIYNFRELSKELRDLGHQFRTDSDTEVIVHAYEEWGIGFVERIRGMFACAIYDETASSDRSRDCRIYLIRDRLGIKPLYLWKENSGVLFSSEVRSLLSSEKIPRKIDLAGVYTYLAFGSVQEPLTLVEGIHSLTPGSWLRIDLMNGKLEFTQKRYWNPDFQGATNPAPEQVREWLQEAVDSHLVSDVTLGAFLSGGMDSGTIAALASTALTTPLRTFTLGFENWSADERDLAEITARRWKTDHRNRVVSKKDILEDLPQALKSMDQPTMDGINSWYVSREARKAGLTVALSGVGGDELFAGYQSFRLVRILKHIPHSLTWLQPLFSGFTPLEKFIASSDFRRKAAAYLVDDLPVNHPYFAVRGLFPDSYLKRILGSSAWDQLTDANDALKSWKASVESQIQYARNLNPVSEVSWLELTQYTRSTLLRDTDMMSMAHSLEVRVPFLDHPLVEKTLAVRAGRKHRRGVQKALLMEAMAADLPGEIISGAKRTFTFPFQVWLNEGLADEIEQVWKSLGQNSLAWLNLDAVDRILQEFRSGSTNWARPWSIYVLINWVRNYL